MIFKGSATALVTPFSEGKVDYSALRDIIDMQLDGGSAALVMCGTTGEASTLSDEERIEIISCAVNRAKGRVPVIAGTGSNDTAHSAELSKKAAHAGADALLIVTPYYNKTSPAGLKAHYGAIAEAAKLPIIMYNVPSRTGLNMKSETVGELSREKYIVALKEASADMGQSEDILRAVTDDFALYSGGDEYTLCMLVLGAQGVISTTGNIAPRHMARLCEAFFKGDIKEAARIQLALKSVIDALFCEVNPIPVKYAVSRMGLCRNELRLPLVGISEANARRVDSAMALLDSI